MDNTVEKNVYVFLTFIDSPTLMNCYAQDIILYELAFKILNSHWCRINNYWFSTLEGCNNTE